MASNFNKKRTGFGTAEWSDYSHNSILGCSHDCKYCYARADAIKASKITDPTDWPFENCNMNSVRKAHRQYGGVTMYPTRHDITPAYLEQHITAIRNILDPGNEILIVTKAHLKCIERICKEFQDYKDRILIRITIGSVDEKVCKFWEPGAPSPQERITSLKYAFDAGFKNSVSSEPMLGGVEMAVELYHAVAGYITDDIWFGKMNSAWKRVDVSDLANRRAVEEIIQQQSDKNIMELVRQLDGCPKVMWKESISEVLQKEAA